MLIAEGALPFIWLPIWLCFISDHPRKAKWISQEERDHLETTLRHETGQLEPPNQASLWRAFLQPTVFVMLPVYFLQNCAVYGCNTFLTEGIKSAGQKFTGFQTAVLHVFSYEPAVVIQLIYV